MNHLLFCTRTGASTLPTMIESLLRVKGLRERWRIIAVDNGSTDGSRELLRAASRQLPLNVLSGADGGKNQGLNLALDSAASEISQSELVVFTDDDIVADPHWLDAMIDGARASPQASMFGGSIEPRWPMPLPAWLETLDGVFDVLFARTHAIEGPCDAHHLYGPNMAIRGTVFAHGYRFDPRIGPTLSATYRMGSETELVQRLERDGHRAVFVPAARVHHQVRAGQMSEQFVLARARRHGLGQGELAARMPASHGLPLCTAHLGRLVASETKSLLVHLPWWRARRVKVLYGRQWLRGFWQGYWAHQIPPRRYPPAQQPSAPGAHTQP
ncbi:MAG: glycosyltransferase [Burkholderiaceae bacterium]